MIAARLLIAFQETLRERVRGPTEARRRRRGFQETISHHSSNRCWREAGKFNFPAAIESRNY